MAPADWGSGRALPSPSSWRLLSVSLYRMKNGFAFKDINPVHDNFLLVLDHLPKVHLYSGGVIASFSA